MYLTEAQIEARRAELWQAHSLKPGSMSSSPLTRGLLGCRSDCREGEPHLVARVEPKRSRREGGRRDEQALARGGCPWSHAQAPMPRVLSAGLWRVLSAASTMRLRWRGRGGMRGSAPGGRSAQCLASLMSRTQIGPQIGLQADQALRVTYPVWL